MKCLWNLRFLQLERCVETTFEIFVNGRDKNRAKIDWNSENFRTSVDEYEINERNFALS